MKIALQITLLFYRELKEAIQKPEEAARLGYDKESFLLTVFTTLQAACKDKSDWVLAGNFGRSSRPSKG